MGVVSCGTTMLDQGVFKNIGSVTWDTTVKTSGFTAVSGNGYFCNTTSAAFTVTLPSSPSAGDIVGIKDYLNTADTNNITIGRNSSNIQGEAADFVISTEGRSVFLVYVDATKGWLVTSSSQASDIASPQFVTATGGTITESGDFKIHTFTSPGTFCVSNAGNACGSTSVDYMVVAGGGGGGAGEGSPGTNSANGGGAGAGGYRESSGAASGCYSRSPLGACVSALPVSATGYPITVGAGGAAGPQNPLHTGLQGSNSIFSSITSTGGGFGGRGNSTAGPGGSGGSVGGACGTGTAGTGNTPPVSPPQGQSGATNPSNSPPYAGSGGGGATAAGSQGSGGNAGNGGAGATSSINATPTGRAGGGGGGKNTGTASSDQGFGGGFSGSTPNSNGDTNTGGGGGGANGNTITGGAGGSGVVIIRYKFQ